MMGTLLTFPARPFPKPATVSTVDPAQEQFALALLDLGKAYPSTADRAADFFRLSQTGPLRARSGAMGAAFAELASIPTLDASNSATARLAALLLVAIAFPTTSPGAA
ncbi:MAG: hypothetical protein WCO83_02365 [Alphaproteobacteria bacterium]